jgi:hypothetical protein
MDHLEGLRCELFESFRSGSILATVDRSLAASRRAPPGRPCPPRIDQQLGEGATLWVAPELADPVGSVEVGEHQDVEKLGAGSGAEGVEALPWSELEFLGQAEVTLRVTLAPSQVVPFRPAGSWTIGIACTNGRAGTSREGSGRAGFPSQGGDTGSNPVGTTSKSAVRAHSRLSGESAGPFVPHLSRGRPRHVTASAAETTTSRAPFAPASPSTRSTLRSRPRSTTLSARQVPHEGNPTKL